MSTKDNARTAWKELAKMVGLEATEEQEDAEERTEFKKEAPTSQSATSASAEKAAPAPIASKIAPNPIAPKAAPAPKVATSLIAEGTVIRGDLSSNGDLTINGTIHGNITCGGMLQCQGKVEGNISAQSIVLNAAKINGDVCVKGEVQIDQESMLVGNVKAETILLDGKLKGDLTISGMTQLHAHAILLGNISTDRLSIQEGSRFSGSLKMTEAKDISNIFPKESE